MIRDFSTKLQLFFVSFAFFSAALPMNAELQYPEVYLPQLNELINEALIKSVDNEIAELELEKSEAEVQIANSQHYPQARAYARILGAYDYREDVDSENRGVVNAGINLSKPLFHWGAVSNRSKIAEYRLAVAKVDYATGEDRKKHQIREAYLQWLLASQNETIIKKSLDVATELVEAQKQLLEAGQASEQYVLELEARQLERLENIEWIERRKDYYKTQLIRLVGSSEVVDSLSVEDAKYLNEIEIRGNDLGIRGLLLDEAIENSPEIRRNQYLVEIQEKQIEIIEKNNYPKVDFVVGAYSDQIDSINQNDQVIRVRTFAGVQVNWNVFDGWRNQGYKRKALAEKRLRELRLEETGERITSTFSALLKDLELSSRQVAARAKREELLRRRVELLREQSRRNLIPVLELLEGELDYERVLQRLSEARVDYLLTLSAFIDLTQFGEKSL